LFPAKIFEVLEKQRRKLNENHFFACHSDHKIISIAIFCVHGGQVNSRVGHCRGVRTYDFSIKLGGGSKVLALNLKGTTLFCVLLHFCYQVFWKYYGGVFCHTPSLPVCIYEQAHVSKLCLNILRERERDCMIRMKRCQKMVYILQKKTTYARFCFFAR